jgi:dihydroneopterin aldolase
MAKISLNGMRFFSHHGCFDAERVVGTNFCVNLSFDTNTEKAERSDDISDTVSYWDVYQVVKSEMQSPSNLLEHVARRIANSVTQAFPQISNLEIEIQKLNPPLGGEIDAAVVKLNL